MANIIIPNGVRKAETEHIMKSYVAARTNEAVNMANNRRRYF